MYQTLLSFFTRYKRYYKACIVGFIGLLVQLAIFNILRLYIKATYANTIAVEIAIISNFILNHYFTFKDKQYVMDSSKTVLKKFLLFNLTSLSSMVVQFICLHISTTFISTNALVDNITVIIGIILGSIVNFLWYQYVIWK